MTFIHSFKKSLLNIYHLSGLGVTILGKTQSWSSWSWRELVYQQTHHLTISFVKRLWWERRTWGEEGREWCTYFLPNALLYLDPTLGPQVSGERRKDSSAPESPTGNSFCKMLRNSSSRKILITTVLGQRILNPGWPEIWKPRWHQIRTAVA